MIRTREKGGGDVKIMAVDLGVARTGLAICDESETLASPLTTVCERRDEPRLEKVAEQIRAHGAAAVVVGHPKNMDGTCGESAERAERFADALREKTGLPVTLWDERLTTVSAHGYLNETDIRGKKRKAVVDTVAAAIILQNYLDSRRARGSE